MTPRLRTGLLGALALLGFYFPSSLDGQISRTLTVVSLIGVTLLLMTLIAGRGGLGRPASVLNSLIMIAVLTACTLLSPFDDYSPGVVVLYLAVAVLFCMNVRAPVRHHSLMTMFGGLTVASITLGLLMIGDVGAVDAIIQAYYSAFRPTLVTQMLEVNKPVLTFATHSMAAFMVYLLFFMALRTYSSRGSRIWLVAAVADMMLLLALRSTSGYLFLALAVSQIAVLLARRHPGTLARLVLGSAAVVMLMSSASRVEPGQVTDAIRAGVLGDERHGFVARYATDGLLATNFVYIAEHPLRPIGFGFSPDLYLGDSGVVVNQLRGSVPLILCVYGGLFLFLTANLHSRATAVWLWLVIASFEIGFTPLQYFRFLAFLPFVVVYLNSVHVPRPFRHAMDGET